MNANYSAPQRTPRRTDPQRSNTSRVPQGPRPVRPLLARLQAGAGNRTLHRLLTTHGIQAQLTVGPVDDEYEREASQVANQVMRMPDGGTPRVLQRYSRPRALVQKFTTAPPDDSMMPAWMCSSCAKHEDESSDEGTVQRQASSAALPAGGPVNGETETHLQGMSRGGHPLPQAERDFFEPRFGTSFADVRLHTDARANTAARTIGADAFTLGTSVAFREGQYKPGTDAGRRLLAHELTHVIQQTGRPQASVQRTIGDGHDLTATRFAGNIILEACFDNERRIDKTHNSNGEHVRLLQDSLLAMGYALPRSPSAALPGRGDGIYRDETEAAVRQFQTDAGAAHIDGIVAIETMGLFDLHDPTRPGGAARPPQRTGPVPDPLARAGCDRHFAGVTFALANQVAASVTPGADIRVAGPAAHRSLRMRGITPITYTPQITITAPTNAAASNFRVGFVQNVLTVTRLANYNGGGTVATVVPNLPIKDGDPTNYHPIFVTQPAAGLVQDFATTGQAITLTWPDVPADAFFIEFLDNAACTGPRPAQQMTAMRMIDTFRIWTVVQHRPSGCVRSLHHVDWMLFWVAGVSTLTTPPTVFVAMNTNAVTVADGDGTPAFIQGGEVPGIAHVNQCT
jgi:peptidoglycan hydrolase-like protein with peptidoglycan-binding domain